MKYSSVAPSLIAAAITLQLASVNVAAQTVPVVELGAPATAAARQQAVPTSQSDNAASARYDQSQMLQEEVRQLRGLVEELSYELQRVKQRQMDDYLDLDRRLSAQQSGRAPADLAVHADTDLSVDSSAQNDATVTVDSSSDVAINAEEIAQSYAQASNLLLRQRDINAAALAFKQHVVDYPNSPYTANAYYWLGEIYLLQGQDEMARQAFTTVVEQYPTHGKALDGTFKLGKIYFQLGEIDRARELLEKAAKGNSGAASKAQSFLKNNF